jgi:adenylosuccinate synthase
MPVTVVVGGQFGSEGKGKVAHYLAREMAATVAIRVGGPNSGHTVIDESGRPVIFKQLPTAALLPDVHCVLPAGSYIRLGTLQEEIRRAELTHERLIIDPNAVIITDKDVAVEKESSLRSMIGSTQSGTGSAVIARAARLGKIRLARDEETLRAYVRPVIHFLRGRLDDKERRLIEGTQGFGLSLLHTPHYPYATSRDTTAAGFVSEAGLSPRDVDDIVMVIRAFPIRVPGNSGPLDHEITWDDVQRESRSPSSLEEHTSATLRLRRVARFEPTIVTQAILYNKPTRMVLNHLDHVDVRCTANSDLTSTALTFLTKVESSLGMNADYAGFGPDILVKTSCLRTQSIFKLGR